MGLAVKSDVEVGDTVEVIEGVCRRSREHVLIPNTGVVTSLTPLVSGDVYATLESDGRKVCGANVSVLRVTKKRSQ